MIAITIPTVTFEKIEGSLVKKTSELVVNVDTSFASHLKWEEHFQQLKNGVDLSSMIAVISDWIQDEKESRKHLTDILRVLYCFIDSPKLPRFNDFVSILDIDNIAVVIEKISAVIQEVGNYSAKK
ncbi:MAG: hypothetical protein ABII85_01845 [Bacillota bacterium]